MITIQKKLSLNPLWLKPWCKDKPLESALLFDIETTGFSAKNHRIYLISAIYFRDEEFQFHQWLSDNTEDEAELLFAFHTLLPQFELLIQYNGHTFDIPFVHDRLILHGMDTSRLIQMKEVDIYTLIKPYQKFLPLENLKLKTVEKYFGYPRTDEQTGGELIRVYLDFINYPAEALKDALLLHNEEDVIGLYYCLQSYTWLDFFDSLKNFSVKPEEMIIHQSEEMLQVVLSFHAPLLIQTPYLQVESNRIVLALPLISEELKYYFDSYKDYYYLPAEDMAVHVSVAQFVAKDHKIKATKETACIKKRGIFIPLLYPHDRGDKTYRRNFHDQTNYIEFSNQLLLNSDFIQNTIMYLLKRL